MSRSWMISASTFSVACAAMPSRGKWMSEGVKIAAWA